MHVLALALLFWLGASALRTQGSDFHPRRGTFFGSIRGRIEL